MAGSEGSETIFLKCEFFFRNATLEEAREESHYMFVYCLNSLTGTSTKL